MNKLLGISVAVLVAVLAIPLISAQPMGWPFGFISTDHEGHSFQPKDCTILYSGSTFFYMGMDPSLTGRGIARMTIKDPSDAVVYQSVKKANYWGFVGFSYTIPEEPLVGTYTIKVEAMPGCEYPWWQSSLCDAEYYAGVEGEQIASDTFEVTDVIPDTFEEEVIPGYTRTYRICPLPS